MNFQSDIQKMKGDFDALKRQSSSTNEAWNDPIQKKYYDQFINPLTKEVDFFLNELNKLDKSFENAERIIKEISKL